MTLAEKFKYEMMDTPTLAQHMQRAKDSIRITSQLVKKYSDGADKRLYEEYKKQRRDARALHKKMEDIMQSRQMRMF